MSAKSFDQFVCLAGMPRAGSTVLAAILSQNPAIHTEGNSPMCQMMWDTYLSYQDRCSREFASNNKNDMLPKIIGQIPHVYYSDAFQVDVSGKDVSGQDLSGNLPVLPVKRTVVDRCRSWTNECNLNMLRSSVDPQIKVIVMDRPLQDVMESYARLFSTNHMGSALDQVLPQLLGPGTEPVMRAWELVQGLKASNQKTQEVEDRMSLVRWAKERRSVGDLNNEVGELDVSGVDVSGLDVSGGEIQDISGNKVEPPIDDLRPNFVGSPPSSPKSTVLRTSDFGSNPYKDMFCFVTYDELVDNPVDTLKRIYAHCGWEPFEHDFDKIVMKNPEDEKVHGLVGQYTVREKLVKVVGDSSILPDSVLEKIWEIEGKMQITV